MLKSSMHCSRNARAKYSFRLGTLLATLLLVSGASIAQEPAGTNRCLKLDGNGSYVELPPDIFKNLTQATVEVWAKWAEFAGYSRVFEFGAGYQSMSLFNHATSADLRFNVYPRFSKFDRSAMFSASAKGLLRSDEWMHLAAVSGPGGMKLYANGRLVAQHTNTASFADIQVTQTNLLGRGLVRNVTDRDFRGELDEVRVWDHPRTLAQIRDNMFKRLTGKEEGLTHLWNFDDGNADDSGPYGHDGTLMGRARIVQTDLELAPVPVPVARVVEATNPTPNLATAVSPLPAAVTVPASNPNPAVWWIAGALVALVVLLACLIVMLRRSGLGTTRLLPASSNSAVAPRLANRGPDSGDAAAMTADPDLKERALADLTDFARQSLVQGLFSQRAALMEMHEKAQQELAALESRVVALQLPERIQAYENRIAELEAQLITRSDELRELTLATLQVLRDKLEDEKQKQSGPGRFN